MAEPPPDRSPRRWGRRILVLILLGLVVVVFALGRDREASYGGVTLAEWVHRYQMSDARANTPETQAIVDAIRRIGTNHLGELMALLAYDPTARRQRVTSIGHHLPRFLHRPFILGPLLTDQKEFRANTASTALAVLGPEAGRELPELTRLMEATNSGVVSRRAMWVLVNVGPEGMPPLMRLLTNRYHPNRVFAVDYIGDFGTNAAGAIPALTEALTDPALAVRLRATNTLRKVVPGIKLPPE